MRHIKQGFYQAGAGNAISGGTVTVYLAGTTTLASIYTASSGGTAVNSVTSAANGLFSFYVDDADYNSNQLFDIAGSKANYQTVTEYNVRVLPFASSGYTDTVRAANVIAISPCVNIEGYLPAGYVRDGSVDYYTQIKTAANAAEAAGYILYFPVGTWQISQVLRTSAEIRGDGALKSTIYNSGTGDALDLGGASYYSVYQDFQVKGNASSRDGITLFTTTGDNPAYVTFTNVHSIYNGRHGLYHTRAWGTMYSHCQFDYNEGLGVLIFGTDSAQNGVSFFQCNCRWNGGTSASTTYTDAKGGISISGGISVSLIGGIYESNNAWQILVGRDQTYSMSSVIFQGIYTETSTYPTVGGVFYFNYGSKFDIAGVTIGFSSRSGQTSYAYYIDSSMTGTINEHDNYYLAAVAGTSPYINTGKSLNRTLSSVITIAMGDISAGGSAATQTLLTATDDGEYRISGTITCGRNSETGGVFPFIATRNGTARAVTVGSSIVGTATSAPTMAWSSDNLQVTWAAYHAGHVEFTYSYVSVPTTFTLNSTYIKRNDELNNLPF